jgi:Uma2 family endonuclease
MAAQPATEPSVYRLGVDAYNRIVASGALEGERVELLEGVLTEMSPLSPDHTMIVTMLMRHFARAPRWWTQSENPLEVDAHSQPQPDLTVAARKPTPGEHLRDPLIVIEVAVSSRRIDRGVKARLYARAGIPSYWLVDVPGRTIEAHTEPEGDGYRRRETYDRESVLPSPLVGVEDLDVAALFAAIER